MVGQLLSILFPPELPGGIIDREVVTWRGGNVPEMLGDGIVWRAYNVALTGIERTRLREEGRV